ncbi:TraB/GumN family protein [Rhizobium sp. LC145]|uniref:TraB/GumN family protein n=1 Tax=Rhizobium sp. LC145 TaxID=1120688 RepID=UPI000629E83E|nr:TraB/GumN family protein [Rhizobium sp. LC145]KKX27786.1 polysaccharide biosynthesis protein GumN [Rhizobium sp. LC145]TKT57047.1 polysaccharide biosynthesis protein GumN [Rhizobiaceae bacterium LC148]
MTIPAFAFNVDALFRRAQNAMLWLLAALHILLFASLLLVLGSLSEANAATPVCGGENLLGDLKAEKPGLYEEILSEGSRVPNGKGLFWKVEKTGLAPSYLLGTMHVSDPRVLKMPPGAAEAQAEASTIVIESDEILDEKKATAALLSKPELTMFTDGNSIEKLLPKEDVALLEKGLKQRGIPLAAVSRMKPWMLMAFVSLPPCELARKAQNAAFLDKKIATDAIAAGKQVKGLETLAEQLSTMAAIPMDLHLKSLVETIKLGSRMEDVFETMTELYLSEDIGLTMPLLKAVAPDGTDDQSGYGEFEELVVVKRNQLMAERAAPILAEGGAFIAVGALHLPGEQGLIELLREQGFTVTRAE